MRIVLFRVTLAFTLLLPLFCPAELVYYHGTLKTTSLGGQGASKQNFQAWVVLDTDTGNMAKINFFSTARHKLYGVQEYPGFQTSTVVGPYHRTNSIITKAETSLDQSNQLLVTSIFLQGVNRHLLVKQGTSLWLPSLASWSLRNVFPSPQTGHPEIWTETGMLAYSSSRTIASNNRGDTLAVAEANLITEFQTKGYLQWPLQ